MWIEVQGQEGFSQEANSMFSSEFPSQFDGLTVKVPFGFIDHHLPLLIGQFGLEEQDMDISIPRMAKRHDLDLISL